MVMELNPNQITTKGWPFIFQKQQIFQSLPFLFTCFDLVGVLDLLLQHGTENTKKTLLGNFQSSLLHSFDVLIRSWKRNGSHIAHAANTLYQSIVHEVPAIILTKERLSKQLLASKAKLSDFSVSLELEIGSFASTCNSYSIDATSLEDICTDDLSRQLSVNIRASLQSCAQNNARRLFDRLSYQSTIKQAVDFYTEWKDTMIINSSDYEDSPFQMKNILLVLDRGYESLENFCSTSPTTAAAAEHQTEGSIDWGDLDLSGDLREETKPTRTVGDLYGTDTPHPSDTSVNLRSLRTELMELYTFFSRRIHEMGEADGTYDSRNRDFIDLVIAKSTPPHFVTYNHTAAMKRFSGSILDCISHCHVLQDSQISCSANWRVEQLLSSWFRKREKIHQLRLSLTNLEERCIEFQNQLDSCAIRLQYCYEGISHLRLQLEQAISEKCDNRVVSISIPTY